MWGKYLTILLLLTTLVYADDIETGLVGRYTLDGTVNDYTGNSDGTNNGVTWNGTSYKIGNGSGVFDGANDYITIAKTPQNDFTLAENFSVSLWVKIETDYNDVYIFNSHNYPSDFRGWALYCDTGDDLRFMIGNGTRVRQAELENGCIDNVGKWVLVTGVYNGTDRILYVNDTQVATYGVSLSGDINSSNPIKIGADYNGNKKLNGTVDEVCIWNRTLSTGEISYLWNSSAGAPCANLTTAPYAPTYNNTNLTCQIESYVEGYYRNHTMPLTINIPVSGNYYNIGPFTQGDTSGFIFTNTSVLTLCSGLYYAHFDATFIGSNINEYEFEIRINNITEPGCVGEETGALNQRKNVAFSCILRLEENDNITIQVTNEDAANDIDIYYTNANIHSIITDNASTTYENYLNTVDSLDNENTMIATIMGQILLIVFLVFVGYMNIRQYREYDMQKTSFWLAFTCFGLTIVEILLTLGIIYVNEAGGGISDILYIQFWSVGFVSFIVGMAALSRIMFGLMDITGDQEKIKEW